MSIVDYDLSGVHNFKGNLQIDKSNTSESTITVSPHK
jgi:hypothetical protein